MKNLVYLLMLGMFVVPKFSDAQARTAPAMKPKVLIVGMDGVYPPALEQSNTPTLDALIRSGCYTNQASTGEVTVSGPGWSSVLCGVWMDKHEVPDNEFLRPQYDRYPSIFTLLKQIDAQANTAAFTSWEPIHKFILFDADIDHKVFHQYEEGGDAQNVSEAAEYLRTAEVDLIFFYFSDIDSAGHTYGFHPSVPEYRAEIEQVDQQLGELVNALRDRPRAREEDWLILITTDHGGTLDRSHGRNEPKHRNIFYLASGAAAARGTLNRTVNQVDIVPTALTHLGVAIRPEWALDGRVSGLVEKLETNVNLLYNGDAEHSTGYESASTNAGIAGWRDWGNVTAIRYGASEGFPTLATRGPESRGNNFFAGGPKGDSEMSQLIDVSALGALIDRAGVRCELSGWLGGYSDQRDLCTLTARFLNEDGTELGRTSIGPVTIEDRQREIGGEGPALTGLLERRTSTSLPLKTRRIEVSLEFEVADGGNDGYADNLSLVLRTGR